MELVELSFRNEKVYMTKNDITGIIKEDWFLKNILEANYFSNRDEGNLNLEINEDKNTAMSLIESMRYNKLIVYPKVSMDYLLLLAEKWCIPETIIEMIKYRINNNINVNIDENLINQNNTLNKADFIIFKCENCYAGFKMAENKKDSCIYHSNFHPGIHKFMCCGQREGSLPCTMGYHNMSYKDKEIYLKIKYNIEININN